MALAADDLATTITQLVRAVEGVGTVYSRVPVTDGIRAAVSGVIGGTTVDLAPVRIEYSDSGVEVQVSIGVTPGEPAPAVCRRVYAAVDELLAAWHPELARVIDVTVGSVD